MSRRELIEAAKASIEAFSEKDWNAVREAVAPDIIYDEVVTGRKAEGIEEVLTPFPQGRFFQPGRRSTSGAVRSSASRTGRPQRYGSTSTC